MSANKSQQVSKNPPFAWHQRWQFQSSKRVQKDRKVQTQETAETSTKCWSEAMGAFQNIQSCWLQWDQDQRERKSKAGKEASSQLRPQKNIEEPGQPILPANVAKHSEILKLPPNCAYHTEFLVPNCLVWQYDDKWFFYSTNLTQWKDPSQKQRETKSGCIQGWQWCAWHPGLPNQHDFSFRSRNWTSHEAAPECEKLWRATNGSNLNAIWLQQICVHTFFALWLSTALCKVQD